MGMTSRSSTVHPPGSSGRMTRRLPLLLLLTAAAVGAHAAGDAPLTLEATIPLEHTQGRIDHMAVDLGRGRLFVAELGNGTVDVVDITRGRVIARLGGLSKPQGIGYSPRADLVAVAGGGDGTVRLYRGEDLTAAGTVPLGEDADNVRVEHSTGNLVVGYGRGALAVIDPVRRAIIANFGLPGHPEGFQLDPARGLAFVNVPDARQVAVIDLSGARPAATWRVPGALGNFPMAFDADRGEVAIVSRSPPELMVADASTGHVKTRVPACGDADDVFFDARRERLYASCGSGEVATWQRDGSGLQPLPAVRTESGARTSLFVPELDRLFVARRAGLLGSGAAILVFRPEAQAAAK